MSNLKNTLGRKLEKSSEDSSDKDDVTECRESLMQREEIVKHFKIVHGHKWSSRVYCITSFPNFSCEDVLEVADRQDRLWGRESQSQNEDTIRPLDEIDRKVNEIVTRIVDDEHDRKKDRDEKSVFEKMFVRLGKIERENKILKDENMALKLENFDLR